MSAPTELNVEIVPWIPDQERIAAASRRLTESSVVQEALGDARSRELAFALVEPETKTKQMRRPPTVYRSTIYDYSNNRAIEVTGRLDDPEAKEVTELGIQPLPNDEEFQAAVAILRDSELGPAIQDGRVQPYRPMPPIVLDEAAAPEGVIERTLAVGLLPRDDDGLRHEIVGVNMVRETVIRFDRSAPDPSLAGADICGFPDAGQQTVQSAAGAVRVTVTQGGTVLWRFFAVRPAASSGTNGSGVELRFVDYRGKRVLYRAHVPILNVLYEPGGCGCYRDWQNQEGMIEANGSDVAPGFRFCPTPAKTILDTDQDAGNFLGVAIYVQGQEVVLVSEMQAGWYRYVSEWRLHANGTIRPRFGFSGVTNSCICHEHHHHAYWRLDFDIRTADGNFVQEFNDRPLSPGGTWHTHPWEVKRYNNAARQRKWRIGNVSTGEGYELIPGANDGTAKGDTFARGDLWLLRYRDSEIDDGVMATFPCEADLDRFVNGEAVSNHDVVLWYSAHFTHTPGDHGHVVGPDLTPVNW